MNRKQLPAFGIKKDKILKLFSLSPCKKKNRDWEEKKKPNFFCIVLSIEKSTLVKSVRQRTEVYRSISSVLREKKSLSNIETIYVEFRIQFHIP